MTSSTQQKQNTQHCIAKSHYNDDYAITYEPTPTAILFFFGALKQYTTTAIIEHNITATAAITTIVRRDNVGTKLELSSSSVNSDGENDGVKDGLEDDGTDVGLSDAATGNAI